MAGSILFCYDAVNNVSLVWNNILLRMIQSLRPFFVVRRFKLLYLIPSFLFHAQSPITKEIGSPAIIIIIVTDVSWVITMY